MKTCESCHSFRLNHPDLDPRFRGTGKHGLCVSPWTDHKTWHRSSTACAFWQEREVEKLQRECPQCQARVWKWLYFCDKCGHDLREKCKACGLPVEGELPICQCEVPPYACSPRRKRDNRPDGGKGHLCLSGRRALSGY